MPSTSAPQARLMRAAAHDPAFAKKADVPQGVAREFVQADKAKALANEMRKDAKR